jgi:hypothetical protein
MQHVLLDMLSDAPDNLDSQSEDRSEAEDKAAQPHRAIEREDEDVSYCGQTGLPEHCCCPKKHRGIVKMFLTVNRLGYRSIVVALRNTEAL